MFRALALRQRKTGFFSDEGTMRETLDYTIYIYIYIYIYILYYIIYSIQQGDKYCTRVLKAPNHSLADDSRHMGTFQTHEGLHRLKVLFFCPSSEQQNCSMIE